MRILSVRFKNINSLEGENKIDFEQPPFSETGVFAITGPNGAGKSSILDAITLGLYGETFRFNRPAEHVMTKHTAESFAEIQFVVDKVNYLSSWQVNRDGKQAEGTIDAATMSLLRLSDQALLATTPTQVRLQLAELTGMNFRGFTRSILLAQGDFAAFLHALDNERMDILEKIISTDIYADYKQEIDNKADEAQQRLIHLQQDLAVLAPMPTEQFEACEHDLHDFTEQAAELRTERKSLEQQLDTARQFVLLTEQAADQQHALQQLQEAISTQQQKLAQLQEQAPLATQFVGDVDAIETGRQQLQQGKIVLQDYRNELKQLQDQLGSDQPAPEIDLSLQSLTDQGQLLQELRKQNMQLGAQQQSEADLQHALSIQIEEKSATLASVSEWLDSHPGETQLLDDFPDIGKLKTLRDEITELQGKQKSLSKWSKQAQKDSKNNQSALSQAIKKLAEFQQRLPEEELSLTELAQGKSLAELESYRQEQQERVNDFRRLHQLAKANRKLSHTGWGVFSWFVRKDQPEQDIDELKNDLELLKQEKFQQETIRISLETAVFRESLLKKMAGDRQHLIEGEPCFLCGSERHPYSSQPPQVTNSQQALIDQKVKLKQLNTSITRLSQQLKNAERQAENNQNNRLALAKVNSEWQTLCNRLNAASSNLNIHKLGVMKQLLTGEIEQLKTITQLVADYRNKLANIEKMKAGIAGTSDAIKQLQLQQQQLDDAWQQRNQQEPDYEVLLLDLRQQQQLLNEKLTGQLALLGEKMPAKNKEDQLFDRLNERRQNYQSYLLRKKGLTQSIDELQAKLAQSQFEITDANEKLANCQQKLQRQEIIALHLAVTEKQQMIISKEQSMLQQEAELARLQQDLQIKMQTTIFTDFEQLKEMLAQLALQPELDKKLQELDQAIELKTRQLEQTLAKLNAEDSSVKSEPIDLQELETRLAQTSERLEITNFEIHRLEQIFTEQQQVQQKAEMIRAQLQQQQQEVQLRTAEVQQIAEESGIVFRRRVQTRVVDQLLSLANAMLEKISGRYYLRQLVNEQGLALTVEDTFQGNVQRLPKSLSGGESFVVSLALALALSEMANNGKSVDSLFLDEGFGNLDAETLYTVISTLEGLQRHGKTVGVISHVEAVQKRFKTQIQVLKKPNGMGYLKQLS